MKPVLLPSVMPARGRYAHGNGYVHRTDGDFFDMIGVTLLKVVSQGAAFFGSEGFENTAQGGFFRSALKHFPGGMDGSGSQE